MNKGRFSQVINEAKQCLVKTEAKVSENNYQIISISTIVLSERQPRKYFDGFKIDELAQSIKKNGIIEPLLVRPLKEEKFELVAGERRLRAAQKAQLMSVPVLIREMSEQQAFQVALIENLQREDLNPVEQTEGIIRFIAVTLDQDQELIPSLLYKMQNEAKGKITPNVWGNPEGDAIIEIFENLGLNWTTFIKTRLPLLNLPEIILEALRSGSIEYTKALEINKLKDETQQNKLLQEAIEEKLSLIQIKERVRQLNSTDNSNSPNLKTRFSKLYNKAKKSKVWEDPKKQKQLEKLIIDLETKIEKLIEKK